MRLYQSKDTDDVIIEKLRKRQQSMLVLMKRAKNKEDLDQATYMLQKYRAAALTIREATKPYKKDPTIMDFSGLNYDYKN
jgi:hypothetical protein